MVKRLNVLRVKVLLSLWHKEKSNMKILTYEEIEKEIGADSLEYLSMASLKEIAKGCKINDFCYGCFTGKYPIEVPETLEKDRFEKIKF